MYCVSFQIVSILYVFGHLYFEVDEFQHKVNIDMKYRLNYTPETNKQDIHSENEHQDKEPWSYMGLNKSGKLSVVSLRFLTVSIY